MDGNVLAERVPRRSSTTASPSSQHRKYKKALADSESII